MIKFSKLVSLVIPILLAHAAYANVVFDGGFETGNHSQWSDLGWNLDRPESEQFEIVTDIVRRGVYSAKMTVHDGDEFLDTGGERVQLERPDIYNEQEGDEYWYQWSTFLPADWQNLTGVANGDDWLLVADWHPTQDPDFENVCQPLQIEIDGNNQFIARMLTGNVSGYDCYQGSGTAFSDSEIIVNNIELGKWNDFVIHVKWTVENDGFVEIWHKTGDENLFTKVFEKIGVPTRQYVDVKSNSDIAYFILAHYRSEEQAHTSVLYQDAFKQATSLFDLDEYNGIEYSDVTTKTSIYRLYNKKTGTQLYTRGVMDRNKILNKYPDFEFTDGAPAFYASTADDGNTPMYRLYNTRTGAQLYTKGEVDRDKILNKYPDFEFTDGAPAFYAAMTPGAGLTPIFRLYNTRTGMHLYTKGVIDRDKILNKYKDFEFTDGTPAFYAEIG